MEINLLNRLKCVLRENDMPMFTDEDLQEWLDTSESFNDAVYNLAMLKSENTGLSISGLNISDTSSYFKRIAAMYRPNHTGTLGGGE